MDKKYAQQIILTTNRNYSAVAERFSRARFEVWPEIGFLFDKYINKGDQVLDLGCGNGRFYPSVFKKEAFYTGLDNSKELIEIAQKKHPQGSFVLGDALSLPFKDSAFDVVFSIAVLHHIPSVNFREKFINECQRVLKPGGFLIITVWDLWQKPRIKREVIRGGILKILGKSKLDFKDVILGWYGKSGYIHCFTQRELENIAKKSKLSFVDSGRIRLKNKKTLSNFFIVLKNKTNSS